MRSRSWTSSWPNYLSCEIAIAACDLAEVLGSALALQALDDLARPKHGEAVLGHPLLERIQTT